MSLSVMFLVTSHAATIVEAVWTDFPRDFLHLAKFVIRAFVLYDPSDDNIPNDRIHHGHDFSRVIRQLNSQMSGGRISSQIRNRQIQGRKMSLSHLPSTLFPTNKITVFSISTYVNSSPSSWKKSTPSARRRCFFWNPRRNSRKFFMLSVMETFVPQMTRWLSSLSSVVGRTWDSEVNWPDWFSRTRTTSRRSFGPRDDAENCPMSARRCGRGVAESLINQRQSGWDWGWRTSSDPDGRDWRSCVGRRARVFVCHWSSFRHRREATTCRGRPWDLSWGEPCAAWARPRRTGGRERTWA